MTDREREAYEMGLRHGRAEHSIHDKHCPACGWVVWNGAGGPVEGRCERCRALIWLDPKTDQYVAVSAKTTLDPQGK